MPSRLGEIGFPTRERDFRSWVLELSEPGEGPHADNFLTNEDSFTRVCQRVKENAPPGTVYLGVGPDQNFTYIAHARPSRAFIIDYRRRNLRLHLLHKALFELSPSRTSYLGRLTARDPGDLPDDADAIALVTAFSKARFDPDGLKTAQAEVERRIRAWNLLKDDEYADVATIQARLAGPGMNARFLALPMYPTLGRLIQTPDERGEPAHFLAVEALYKQVRTRQIEDQVVPIVGNFASNGALPALARAMTEEELRLGVFYISDVEFFLLRDGGFDAYLKNLERLPRHPEALIVRSTSIPLDHPTRVASDDGTTIAEPLAQFMTDARQGRVKTVKDLFFRSSP